MISLISVAASHRTCFCFKELYFFKPLLKVVNRFYVVLVVQFYIKILKKSTESSHMLLFLPLQLLLLLTSYIRWYICYSDEQVLIYFYKLKSIVYIRLHHLCCTVLWVLTNAYCHVSTIIVSHRIVSPSWRWPVFYLFHFFLLMPYPLATRFLKLYP